MRTVCFTVDLDRDANIPSKDSHRALSTDRGHGTRPRFDASRRGTEILVDLFDELDVDVTVFAEARALEETGASMLGGHEVAVHGLDHEDLTGKECGMPMDEHRVQEILYEARDMIRDMTGHDPKGFRAPYMRFDPTMYHVLEGLGFRYDSSQYATMGKRMMPHAIGNVTEFPVPKGIDRDGKVIAGYLWPMHESKRTPDDYIQLAQQMDDGVLVLATHTWHMVESIDDGMFDAKGIKRNIDGVRTILEALLDDGFVFGSMGSIRDSG